LRDQKMLHRYFHHIGGQPLEAIFGDRQGQIIV
jgi:hypothetical protein